jgi:uncharacterized iron-regulated protein
MEIKRGGKRVGAGRKPIAEKKKAITIYLKGGTVLKFGSEDAIKQKLVEYAETYNEKSDGKNVATHKLNEVAQRDRPNEDYFSPPKEIKKRVLVRSFEQYVVLKKDCADSEEWAVLADEIRNSYLTEKQKALLLKAF